MNFALQDGDASGCLGPVAIFLICTGLIFLFGGIGVFILLSILSPV